MLVVSSLNPKSIKFSLKWNLKCYLDAHRYTEKLADNLQRFIGPLTMRSINPLRFKDLTSFLKKGELKIFFSVYCELSRCCVVDIGKNHVF